MSDPATKTVALLLSTMRSGSTLLKALLATAPDISDLPETNFQRFRHPHTHRRLYALAPEPILLLKRPAWFNELNRYPQLPELPDLRRIVLIRDAYANVLSIRRMLFRKAPLLQRLDLGNRFLVENYWSRITTRLSRLAAADPAGTVLVRYEDVVADPTKQTARLFAFLGSEQTEGTATYEAPADYDWRWGRDDGSEHIKSLTVRRTRQITYADQNLLRAIKRSGAAMALRRQLGYPELP